MTPRAHQYIGGGLDGYGNRVGGDDYVLVGGPAVAPGLFRFFGDSDGDADNDGVDFLAFRNTSGLSNGEPGFIPNFDFDSDSDVDALDFLQYRTRFGIGV